jgi:5,10-methylene-tetrahydrofolate dehydrogenase/methenyl tetrahydrofolate cyclohydrolase
MEAAMKGEEELRKFCDGQRPGLMNSTAAQIMEMLTSILPDVDKKALRESNELGTFMEQTMRKSKHTIKCCNKFHR